MVRNAPYAGGYTTALYGQPADGVHALQVEVNRALYLDEEKMEKAASFDDCRELLGHFTAALVGADLRWLVPRRTLPTRGRIAAPKNRPRNKKKEAAPGEVGTAQVREENAQEGHAACVPHCNIVPFGIVKQVKLNGENRYITMYWMVLSVNIACAKGRRHPKRIHGNERG